MELYKDFCKNYPVITIEDPFDQDDWDNTTAFTAEGVSQASPGSPVKRALLLYSAHKKQ